jgi:acetyl-CoA carboxylase biotin carboxyl carrier protein
MSFLAEDFPRLLRVLLASDAHELEIAEADIHVRLQRVPQRVEDTAPATIQLEEEPGFAGPATALVRASHVGTFYRAGQPGMPPLVTEGSHVEDSTVIGIIEALNVLTDIEAECRGVVTAVLATDGQPVEYNQPLLEVRLDE